MKKFHLLSTLLPAALLLACGSDPKEPPAAPTGGTEPVSTATQTAGDDALPMQRVEARRDDDQRADPGPAVRQLAEDQVAVERAPQ